MVVFQISTPTLVLNVDICAEVPGIIFSFHDAIAVYLGFRKTHRV